MIEFYLGLATGIVFGIGLVGIGWSLYDTKKRYKKSGRVNIHDLRERAINGDQEARKMLNKIDELNKEKRDLRKAA